jgi:hypothetical protein
VTATPVGRWNYALRTVVLGGFVGLLGWGAYTWREMRAEHARDLAERQQRIDALTAEVASRDRRIEEQGQEIEALAAQVKQLQSALRLLKVDHRLARLTVLEQRPAPAAPGAGAGGADSAAGASGASGAGAKPGAGLAPDGEAATETDVSFQELDGEGLPLGEARRCTLRGNVAYVDALVIKFSDNYVEQGDALRGSSVCLFRRIFGAFQKPSEGFPLDANGSRPLPYAGGDDDPGFESRLWQRFWEYANDSNAAAAAGVRAIHGEAPYIELRPGQRYLVELRASGGLSLRAE